jgi:hypothetical protein
MRMSNDYGPLAAAVNQITNLLVNNPQRLAPFKAGMVSGPLSSSAPAPSIDLSIGGLSGIVNTFGGSSVMGSLLGVVSDVTTLNLAGLLDDLAHLPVEIASFVGQQLSVAVSFMAILQNVENTGDVVSAIRTAYQQYFFSGGFKTIDGATIAQPALASDRNGQQYVRNLVRVTVEATGDQLFGLRGRYATMTALQNQKVDSWFEGFSALADSTVTSTVEEASLGVAAFSSNALIAASLGTFAGTSARKATQHAFLIEIGIR